MRRKGLLALGLFALGSLMVQAAGHRPLDLTIHRPGSGQALTTRGEFGYIGVVNDEGAAVVEAGWIEQTDADLTRGDGAMTLRDHFGNPRVGSLADTRDGGIVYVFDTSGEAAAYMSASEGFWSKHGDLAENFPATVSEVQAGSVMVLDPENPGSLTPSTQAYDRRVAGVVSGASDYRPGITLGAKTHVNGVPITLTGTAYCRVSNVNGPIKAGDLLTSSDVAGHAMKATDPEKSRGAILGKAMEDFDQESGLILMLATLQ